MATKHPLLIGVAALAALSCAAVAGTLGKPSVSTPVTELNTGLSAASQSNLPRFGGSVEGYGRIKRAAASGSSQ